MDGLYVTNRMYRYDALIKAVDFFTQRFTPEQLSKYAFEFANEILTLKASALFIIDGDEFILKSKRLYNIQNYSIKNKTKIQKIATLHGSIILNRFENYFPIEVLDKFDMNLVIPLIIDDLLFGFIISDGKTVGDFNEDDYTMAVCLMRLFNNALENNRNFTDLKTKNKQLDQKIFNLFAINQSARSLLSELELDNLISMAVDIFSEMTSSKITSFGIVDKVSNKLRILGYRNIEDFSTHLADLEIRPQAEFSHRKVMLSLEEDIDLIKELFVNWEEFYSLGAQYVVLLVKDELLGLVTLAEPVNQEDYDIAIFELIESLASFTYIALENAILFEETQRQKQIIEAKYDVLTSFNQLVENINECISIEELCDITLKTLNISFDIEKAFIAFKENEKQYRIKHSIDDIGVGEILNINEKWEESYDGDMIYNFAAENNQDYLEKDLLDLFYDSTGLVISPIITERFNLEGWESPFAYLLVLKTPNNLQEEEVLLIDTITKNISPTIYHMNVLEEHKQRYIPDKRQLFYESINKKIQEKDKFNVNINIYYRLVETHPFADVDLSMYEKYEHYLIDNYLFIICYDDLDLLNFKKIPSINSLKDVLDYNF